MGVTPEHYVEAARRYGDELGWPAVAHGWAVWVLAGQKIDAWEVPLDLAERMSAGLGGPIVRGPRGMTFLTPHSSRMCTRLYRDLAEHGIRWLWCSQRIELPPTRVRGGTLEWHSPPSKALISYPALVGAFFRVTCSTSR